MSTKYLICDVSNEYESAVAVIEVTAERLAELRARIQLAARLKKEDEGFAWLQFFDGVDCYETDEDIRDWIGKNADQDVWEEDLQVVTEVCPDFGSSSTVRVDLTLLNVDEKSCFWEIHPKHATESFTTQMAPLNDLEGE